jgi:hypothetical protein
MELYEFYIKYNKLVKKIIIEKTIINYEFNFEEYNKYRYYKILENLYLQYNPTNDNYEIIFRDKIDNNNIYNYKKIVIDDEIQIILKYMKNTTFWNKLKKYNSLKEKYIYTFITLLEKYEINDNFNLNYLVNELNIIGLDIHKYNQIIINLKIKKEINILPNNKIIKLKFPFDENMKIFANLSNSWYFININNLYFYFENNIKYIIIEQNNIYYFLNKNQNNSILQKIINKMILVLSNIEFKLELENIIILKNYLENEYLKIIPKFLCN